METKQDNNLEKRMDEFFRTVGKSTKGGFRPDSNWIRLGHKRFVDSLGASMRHSVDVTPQEIVGVLMAVAKQSNIPSENATELIPHLERKYNLPQTYVLIGKVTNPMGEEMYRVYEKRCYS